MLGTEGVWNINNNPENNGAKIPHMFATNGLLSKRSQVGCIRDLGTHAIATHAIGTQQHRGEKLQKYPVQEYRKTKCCE